MADLSLGAQCVLGNAFALPHPLTRTTIEQHVEALIALLDHMDGDSDLEDGDEDCCAARDDTGGIHPNDCAGDGLPGDPLDAEDGDEDRCEAGEDMMRGGSAFPASLCERDIGAGDPEDAEADCLGRAAVGQARARIAAIAARKMEMAA